MLRALEGLWNAAYALFEAFDDFFSWRDDWNRTWSPVSYFLAVFAALVLAALLFFYGRATWEYLRGLGFFRA